MDTRTEEGKVRHRARPDDVPAMEPLLRCCDEDYFKIPRAMRFRACMREMEAIQAILDGGRQWVPAAKKGAGK